MSLFFLFLEAFIYGFALYLLVVKKDLAIIYLPVIFFTQTVITPAAPAVVYYATVTFLLATLLYRNSFFFLNNIYALLIAIYFLLLVPKSSDLELIRPFVFGVIWLFLSLPLISSIYRKFTRDQVFQELTHAATLILVIFIANVGVSSLYKYSPHSMYGITSGILFGNLYAANFNILPIAVFISALSLMKKRSTFQFLILIIALAFIMLTLRRSVMGLSMAGVIFAFLISLAQKNVKKVVLIGGLSILTGFIILSNTGFMSAFNERYELRDLDNRELEEEKRFEEYELILKDMFVYGDYSPWFGFELFNSWGNYGRGSFAARSLHSDIPNITHSSGLLGLALYLLMIGTAFRQSYRMAGSNTEKLIILFCAITFLAFTTTGRYTETAYMLLLFLLLLLPVTAEAPQETEIPAFNRNHQMT
jgi:O-Antigen ligase